MCSLFESIAHITNIPSIIKYYISSSNFVPCCILDTEGVRQSLVRESKRVQEVKASAKQDTTVTADINLGNDISSAFASN